MTGDDVRVRRGLPVLQRLLRLQRDSVRQAEYTFISHGSTLTLPLARLSYDFGKSVEVVDKAVAEGVRTTKLFSACL